MPKRPSPARKTHVSPDDDLTPNQRRRAVAQLLARGVGRRLRQHIAAGTADAESVPPSATCLELPAGTRLSLGDTRGLALREKGDEA